MCGRITLDFPCREDLYGKDYFEHYAELAKTHKSKIISAHRWATVRRFMNGHTNVLDFGAGAGAFLQYENAPPGLNLAGVDINPFSPYYLPEGSTVIGDLIHDTQVLTMFDVIEHIQHPRSVIERIDPNVLVILTPNAGNVHPSRFREWRHYKPGEHLHYYTVPALYALFEKLGFCVKWWDFKEGEIRNPESPFDLVTMVGVKE
jgi:hypothetical protein